MKNQNVIQELQKGNQKGLSILYEQYHNEFVGFATKKYSIDNDTAHDFFVETIIEFRRNVVDGKINKIEHSLKTYLFSIGRNLILYHKRENKLVFVEQIREDWSSSQDSHQSTLELEERLKYFEEIFQQLPKNCYELLRMFYYFKLNTKEIQEELDYQNEQTVRTRKYKCSQLFKKLISSQRIIEF